MMFCVNLCELLDKESINENSLSTFFNIKNDMHRVYIGSYFCSQYFMKMNWVNLLLDYCKNSHCKVTLVVPVISEKDVEIAKIKIDEIVNEGQDVVDEITVNDLGMLNYICRRYNNMGVNLGRLFFKDAREPRIAEYNELRIKPTKNTSTYLENYNIKCVELDLLSSDMVCDESSRLIGIHLPFTYVTTGNICKYASTYKAIEKKFRPNDTCGMECHKMYEHYKEIIDGRRVEFYRVGRTVYSYNDKMNELPSGADRYIYFPFLEYVSMVEGKVI